jgi:uncharacterized membrane protein
MLRVIFMSKSDDSKLFAFLGILLTVIGFVIVYATKKNDKYAMFYARQGLILFFAWIAVWIVSMILGMIPVIGWIIIIVLDVALVLLWIIGMIYAFSGEEKNIPVIGNYAKMIKL